MANTFQLEIVTPTRVIDCGPVEYLRAPSVEGLFGVQAGHTRSMISLDVGEIKVVQDGKDTFYATNGGYADIHPNNAQLLVETAEECNTIDTARALSAAQRARERAKSRTADTDHSRAEAALKRALTRLLVAGRM